MIRPSNFMVFLLFLLVPALLLAEDDLKMKYSTDRYTDAWQKVAEDESKGLPKSALEKVNLIYKKADLDKNPSQTIKAVMYRVKYLGMVEEDAFPKALEDLQKESKSASSYVKPVIHSILGEVYWQYYQNNRYYILQRTKTDNFVQTDLRTWDATKLIEASITEYTESLKDIGKTRKIPIEDYSSLLNYDVDYIPNGRFLRPTLYEFLAHRAIDFFSNQEHGLARPAETFIIDDPAYFDGLHEFTNLKIVTKDQLAYKYYALQILQDLAQIHLEDKDPSAIIDIDLKRLNFVYTYSVLEEKGNLYLKSLEVLARKYAQYPVSTNVSYAIASYWHSLSPNYVSDPTEENQWVSNKAYEICKETIQKYPVSDGAQNCKSLQSQIKIKTISITMEKTNIPGKPFLGLVRYKNLESLYFRVYKVDRSKMTAVKKEYYSYYKKHNKYSYYEDILIAHFINEKAEKTFSIKLPSDSDYMEHQVEVKLPELDYGQYLILAGTDKDMSLRQQTVGFAFTNISNLTYIDRRKNNQDLEYYTLNRTTGGIVSGVEVRTSYQIYNNKKSRYEIVSDQTLTTDKSGYFLLKSNKEYKSFFMTLRKGRDFLEPIDEYYYSDFNRQMTQNLNPFYEKSAYKNVEAKLFLDRAIYRPGQIVYFKGILISSNDIKRSTKPNTSVNVTFLNVNHQQISELKLTTNEFGSFSGSFTTPINVLNGEMSLNSSYGGRALFSVEEYKRPKFSVEFEKVKGTYQLGDEIKIKGFAKAYSGANIDNADVKYRVIRVAQYPHWWGYHFEGGYSASPQMEIKQGSLKTDEKGYFEIKFEAVPDLSVQKKPGISFSYQIIADVTDLNGETRSAGGFAYVGYTSLFGNYSAKKRIVQTRYRFDAEKG